jgi:hypothetical protein
MDTPRASRAGDSIEDYCRACATDRLHNVIVVDPGGRPLRVMCGYCRSEHNYRGGPRVGTEPLGTAPSADSGAATVRDRRPISGPGAATARARDRRAAPDRRAFPLVSERERSAPAMAPPEIQADLELMLRRVIREEAGVTPVAPAEKWRGGTLVLRPGTPGLQEKSWPIETFFHKVVMLRNRLRTLEQHVNASSLPDDVKVKLQAYISGCYGSLTSFNVLFADEDDQFKGSSEP